MASTVTLTLDMNKAFCPPGAGMCPGVTCTRPICARPRPGDCVSGAAGPCLMPHVYPPSPFPFEDLVAAYQRASDLVTASMMTRSLQNRDEDVELKQKSLDQLEGSGWRPDWRFFAGVGLAAAGGYTLWKLKKRR